MILSGPIRYFENSRMRIVRAVFLLACVTILFAGSSCSSGNGTNPHSIVASATDLGTIPTNSDILGRDGAFSTLFQSYSVWLYGDTFLAHPDAEGRTLISDSWSFTTDLNAQSGISGFQERLDATGAPTMILQETAVEMAYDQAHAGNPCQQQPCGARWALWPSSIVVDPASNQAIIFYMVVNAKPGSFNFQGYGSSAAVWNSFAGQPQRPTLNPPIVSGHPDLLFGQNEPNFGTASLINNGTLYVYGCGLPDNGGDKGCRLAKVDPGSVQNRSAWNFYAGNGNWSSQLADAVSVFEGSSIVSVSFNSYLQEYTALYSPPFSQNVVIRTAPNPEGPWSPETLAFVAMQPVSGNVYDAHTHPEYDENGGQTIFVTYSRSTGEFSSEVRLESVELHSQ